MSSKMRKYNHPKLYTVFPRDNTIRRYNSASILVRAARPERTCLPGHSSMRKVEDPTGHVGVVDQKNSGSYFHISRKKYVLRITLPNALSKDTTYSRRFCRYKFPVIIKKNYLMRIDTFSRMPRNKLINKQTFAAIERRNI